MPKKQQSFNVCPFCSLSYPFSCFICYLTEIHENCLLVTASLFLNEEKSIVLQTRAQNGDHNGDQIGDKCGGKKGSENGDKIGVMKAP